MDGWKHSRSEAAAASVGEAGLGFLLLLTLRQVFRAVDGKTNWSLKLELLTDLKDIFD